MGEVLLEAILDSLKVLPVLLIIYILIEFMEHKGEVKFEKAVSSSKKLGPLWGAGLGCIPQCGFAAVMSDLFSKKMITIGTLFAVFVATSDEAFAILISEPNHILSVLVLLGFKLVLAIVIGFAMDLVFKKQKRVEANFKHGEHNHEYSHKHEKKEVSLPITADCADCDHNSLHHKHELENEKEQSKAKVFWHIVLQGVWHTLEIFLWILLANVVISLAFYFAGGEDVIRQIMGTNAWYQPFVCALIGLIPNCAGSVMLVELYVSGIISFASCLGGLCASAGIGLIILFKNNKNIKQNLLIVLGLYVIGVVVGLLFNLFLPFSF